MKCTGIQALTKNDQPEDDDDDDDDNVGDAATDPPPQKKHLRVSRGVAFANSSA